MVLCRAEVFAAATAVLLFASIVLAAATTDNNTIAEQPSRHSIGDAFAPAVSGVVAAPRAPSDDDTEHGDGGGGGGGWQPPPFDPRPPWSARSVWDADPWQHIAFTSHVKGDAQAHLQALPLADGFLVHGGGVLLGMFPSSSAAAQPQQEPTSAAAAGSAQQPTAAAGVGGTGKNGVGVDDMATNDVRAELQQRQLSTSGERAIVVQRLLEARGGDADAATQQPVAFSVPPVVEPTDVPASKRVKVGLTSMGKGAGAYKTDLVRSESARPIADILKKMDEKEGKGKGRAREELPEGLPRGPFTCVDEAREALTKYARWHGGEALPAWCPLQPITNMTILKPTSFFNTLTAPS
mmetsp:Transcript_5427/g.13779  ORF Transcript_5427/g.13779 Transcript_5427/m.13779 type:complete len:352 (+) Transcript_5427:115-1170(+)